MRSRVRAGGYGLIELLVAMALLAVLATLSVPGVRAGLERSRAHAAARDLAARASLARTIAAARGATVALWFDTTSGHTQLASVADGNGNGVRRIDIEDGSDPVITAPVSLDELFPGITVLPGGEASGIFSFTPVGTASTGSIEVIGRDGSRFAVRILGATARIRVQRHEIATDRWIDAW